MIGIERKLGVDGNGARRVRQMHKAIGAGAAAQGGLKRIGRRRQRARYDVLQLHFTEGAARLLVGQNVLKSDDLRGKLGDILLRLINQREAFGKRAQGLDRLRRVLFKAHPHARAHLIEPLVERRGQRALRQRLRFRHCRQPAGQFRLLGHKLRKAALQHLVLVAAPTRQQKDKPAAAKKRDENQQGDCQ